MEREQAVTCEQELQQLVRDVGASFLDIGQKLLECQRTRWHNLLGFATFDDFVEKSLQITGRAGRYYARIYRCYVEEAKFPAERLVEIGWTKLQTLLPILEEKTQAGNAIDFLRWFALARESTVRELEVRVLAHLSPEEKERHGLRSA
ncbi:MAG: hypothetical protein AAB538_04715, partial [Patescibacteria group bacterium]